MMVILTTTLAEHNNINRSDRGTTQLDSER